MLPIKYEVRESDVCQSLCKQSEPFIRFYHQEWPKNKFKYVHWYIGSEAQYSSVVISQKRAGILMKTYPIDPDDAVCIAHEMTHLILDSESYPTVIEITPNSISKSLVMDLVQLFSHINIDLRLVNYGFDVLSKRIEEINSEFNEIEKTFGPNIGKLEGESPELEIKYASDALWWSLFGKTYDSRYIIYAKSHFPTITKNGERLFDFIRKTGFDSQEKEKFILNAIISHYDLNSLLNVVQYFPLSL